MCRHIERLLKVLHCFIAVGGLAFVLIAPASAQSGRIIEERAGGSIAGTLIDPNGDPVPGATVTLEPSRTGDRYSIVANETGYFELHNVGSGMPYHVMVHADGFEDWTSPDVVLESGQHKILTGCILRLAKVETSIDVGYSAVQIATEQVAIQSSAFWVTSIEVKMIKAGEVSVPAEFQVALYENLLQEIETKGRLPSGVP